MQHGAGPSSPRAGAPVGLPRTTVPVPRTAGAVPRSISNRPRAGETPRARGADRPRTRGRSDGPRAVPERSPDHAHLTLPSLRAYRATLLEEETRVSYWRRLLQARLDVLTAGLGDGDVAALRPVLTEQRVSRGRRLLESVVPSDDMPPLPDLAGLWEAAAQDDDEAGTVELVERLRLAEADLSAYRSALHARLDAATDELIARYREQPSLCLTALPLSPGEIATAV